MSIRFLSSDTLEEQVRRLGLERDHPDATDNRVAAAGPTPRSGTLDAYPARRGNAQRCALSKVSIRRGVPEPRSPAARDRHLRYSRGASAEESRGASIALMQLHPTEPTDRGRDGDSSRDRNSDEEAEVSRVARSDAALLVVSSGVRPDLGRSPMTLKLLRDLLVPSRYLFPCVSRRFTASRKSRDRSRDEITVGTRLGPRRSIRSASMR